VTEPDTLRTHDDARALLTYAVPGARVEVYRPPLRHWAQRNSERSRAYRITVRRHGAEVACVEGSYALPCDALRLATHAREQVARATSE
jgi:hypothetical protein